MPGSDFVARWSQIQAQIADRTDRRVSVVAVTKFQPLEKVVEALEVGIQDLGVNYVQTGEELRSALGARTGLPKPCWHFIGHIQSRKAAGVAEFDCVQSLDRIEVARKISLRRESVGRAIDVLVEVNIGEEASKSGVPVENLSLFLREIESLPGLKLRGLMAMPPPLEPVEQRRPFFEAMFQLWKENYREGFDTLSMGTSEDFLVAVESGANQIRLGTVLFGPRNTPEKK